MSTGNKSTVRSTVSEPLSRPSRIPTAITAKATTNSWSLPQSPQHSAKRTPNGGSQIQQPQQQPRFEAYMMTGDLILNISKAPRVSNIKATKKVEASQSPVHDTRKNGSYAPHARYDSTSSSNSPSEEHQPSSGSLKSLPKAKEDQEYLNNTELNSHKTKSHIQNAVLSSPSISIKSKSPSLASSNSSSANNSSYSNDAVDCPLIKHSKPQKADKESSIIISASSSVSSAEMSYSVPTSPTSLNTPNTGDAGAYDIKSKEAFNSAPTSPETATQDFIKRNLNNFSQECSNNMKKNKQRDNVGFRTSRSEDPLQQTQGREGMNAVIPIDIDDDFNSSLNTLLDTRNDSDQSQNADRIVWTYNAPVTTIASNTKVITSPLSHTSSSISSSPQRSEIASPTSVSSSCMSSGSKNEGTSNDIQNLTCPLTNDQSVSEAVSNISSPDYQDEQFSARELGVVSDPSDSDSTILASEKRYSDIFDPGNKLIIQIAGIDPNNPCSDNNDLELEKVSENAQKQNNNHNSNNNNIDHNNGRDGSPPVSDDGSDIDSLHSFHYSPKGVDMPSVVRLAKRLYGLEGFRKSDVSKHLSKK